MTTNEILLGDSLEVLKTMPDNLVQCVITSPPYYGLRDYKVSGQLGLEKTPEEYLSKLTEIFREVRRVLRPDGTCWVNIGDSYTSGKGRYSSCPQTISGKDRNEPGNGQRPDQKDHPYLKDKDLMLIPARLAISLQADGWYVRSDIIWHKPNPMPESVKDRPTRSHEYIFLLTKSGRYYYNADAIREPLAESSIKRYNHAINTNEQYDPNIHKNQTGLQSPMEILTRAAKNVIEKGSANARSVWTIPTQPTPDAHFATFPEELVAKCMMAGSKEGDVILDPFMGAGTVALVALRGNRRYLGIELNPKYIEIANRRLSKLKGQEILI